MTKAYSMRIPDDLLRRAKNRCAESGVSLTAFVTGAIEARLEAPSLLDQPMVPVLAPHETCVHPFKDAGRCRTCGEQL